MAEEADPRIPIRISTHPLEQVAVRVSVPLYVNTGVDYRCRYHTHLDEVKENNNAPNPTVPVSEWVYGLKLIVNKAALHNRIKRWMARRDECLQIAYEVDSLVRWRRVKGGCFEGLSFTGDGVLPDFKCSYGRLPPNPTQQPLVQA